MCGGGKSSARWFGKPDTSGWEIYPNTFERRKSWSILNGRLRVFQTARASCLTNITTDRRLLSMLTQLMLAFQVLLVLVFLVSWMCIIGSVVMEIEVKYVKQSSSGVKTSDL